MDKLIATWGAHRSPVMFRFGSRAAWARILSRAGILLAHELVRRDGVA